MRRLEILVASYVLIFIYAHPALAQSASASVMTGDLQGTAQRQNLSQTGTTQAYAGPVGSSGSGSSASAHASVANGVISLSATTTSSNPQQSAAFADATAGFSDKLTFAVASTTGSGKSVGLSPLFALPYSPFEVEITDNLSSLSIGGSANLQINTSFGPVRFSVTDNVLNGLNGSTTAPTPNSISVSQSAFTYIVDASLFGGTSQFGNSTANPIPFSMSASASLADALGYPGGSLSFVDPLTFTILDANGNVIPNVVVESAAGVNYSVTDGYVPDSNPTPTPTPEPGSFILLATGTVATLAAARRASNSPVGFA